jgi:hypothetical protein
MGPYLLIWMGALPQFPGFAALGVIGNKAVFTMSNDIIGFYDPATSIWSQCPINIGWSVKAITVGNAMYIISPVGTNTSSLMTWKLEL